VAAANGIRIKRHDVTKTQAEIRDDHDHLTGLISDHQRCLYLYIYSLVHRTDDTCDVLQETNLALWRDAQRVEALADFRSWAFRVAFNQVLAFRKRRMRDRLCFDDTLLSRLADGMQPLVDQTTDQQEVLRRCARKLPDQGRQLLAMRYTSALSVKVIAEQLGSTVAAVSKSLYRIRASLRKCIHDALAMDGQNQEGMR
jgi:RNA polymerase sigma-70 factor (ECF subfamily)